MAKKLQSKKSNLSYPKGSRFGPLLSIIFINDLIDINESNIILFADNTFLLVSRKTTRETALILNRDLQKKFQLNGK